jgi:hypothetical protein
MSTRRRWAIIGVAVTATIWTSVAMAGTVAADPGDRVPVTASGAASTTATDARLDETPVDVRPAPLEPAPRFGPTPVLPERVGGVPDFGPTSGSEVRLTNADEWHAAGYTGAGVKIGVVDFFDVTRYWDVAEHGPRPIENVTAKCFAFGRDCSQSFFDGFDEGGDDHGVAVVEVIKDMAPDAQIYIGTALTPGDYRKLIDWFRASGVTVMNRSLGARYDGPGDGRGTLNELADYANSLGITWVNSGGNNGWGRYYRQPVRLIGDRVAFGPSGTTTALPFNGCVSLGGVRWANDWDLPPAERTDYDVFLWETQPSSTALDRVVARSEGNQRAGDVPIELLPGQYCPSSSTRRLALEIRWRGGDVAGDVIEILDYGQGMSAFTQAEYSATAPIADSRADGVLAVGAVDPPGSGTIGYYSSQGPTNDGRLSPDISAPSGFSSSVFRSGFSGTSAAAPVVAGAAALLTQAGLAADPAALGNLLRHLTVDRGATGPDNTFGAGELRLPAPPATPRTVPSRFEPAPAPVRVLDTRPTSAAGPQALVGAVNPGDVLDLPLAALVPGDATAVAINITVTQPDRASFAQVLPTLAAPIGGFSNLNLDAAGQTRANFAIVPLSAGSISIYSTGGGHVVVDLVGWFRDAPDEVREGRFVELPVAERVLDTRATPTGPLVGAGTVAVPLPVGVPTGEASALVVTVTGTAPTGPGWLQAHPADRGDVVGATSTVNVEPGGTVANTAIVPISGGMAVSGFVVDGGSVHVIVDVIGYITSEAAASSSVGRYVPITPGRAYDSRVAGELRSGATIEIDATAMPGSIVPTAATGVVWNVAHVAVRRPGFGRVWAAGAAEPETSSFNFTTTAEVRATSVISAVDGARSRLAMNDGVPGVGDVLGHVVVDVFGYFT